MNFFVVVGLIFTIFNGAKCKNFEPDLFEHIRPQVSVTVQEKAAFDVINRLIGEKSQYFHIKVNTNLPLNTFKLQRSSEKQNYIEISGSDGISICKGFYYYLKNYLGCSISWSENQLDNLPADLSGQKLIDFTLTAPNRFIYYQNVCTWSYSFSFWKWAEWRKHIDWMALEGINLSLAPIQEQAWTKVYQDYGLTDDEIQDHLSAPGFEAWQRMGNIRGWGGPGSKEFKLVQAALQMKIAQAQRDLGMILAIPAFAGHLPVAFERLYPNKTFNKVTQWNDFPEQFCCPLFIDPSDNLFKEVGAAFLHEITRQIGSDHIYFSDPFNELEPAEPNTNYLRSTAQSIYAAMSEVDPQAVWLLQGWMFVKNPFWTNDLLKAFLTAVPSGKMLILDLQSEQFPQYERTKSYYGQPFIWCMLNNFGGTLGMYGSVEIVNNRINQTRNMEDSSMVGVGITPEGIYQNYIMYEYALERAWSLEEFNSSEWFRQFVIARYGQNDEHLQKSWDLLRNSVYTFHGVEKMRGKYAVCVRPSVKLDLWTWYGFDAVQGALEEFLQSSTKFAQNSLYQHDLVDLTRQLLQNKGDQLYVNFIEAYKQKNTELFIKLSNAFLDLLHDLERILRTNVHFLLGPWIESARAKAFDEDLLYHINPLQADLFEINARNQITTWGPNGQIVDYATKQWSGIVEDIFLARWKLFFKRITDELISARKYNENNYRREVFNNIENPFSVSRKRYPIETEGNPVTVAGDIFEKWRKFDTENQLNIQVPLSDTNSDDEINPPDIVFT